MDAAEDIKAKGTSSSIEELSVVNVPFENVNILSLSTDSSTLAVSVAAFVHFFSVDSLLKKVGYIPFFPLISYTMSLFPVKRFEYPAGLEPNFLLLTE